MGEWQQGKDEATRLLASAWFLTTALMMVGQLASGVVLIHPLLGLTVLMLTGTIFGMTYFPADPPLQSKHQEPE